MQRELTGPEASQRLLEALAAASIDPTRAQFSVIGNLTALDRLIVATWLSEAFHNGYFAGEQAAQLRATYAPHHTHNTEPPATIDEVTQTRDTDRLNHL